MRSEVIRVRNAACESSGVHKRKCLGRFEVLRYTIVDTRVLIVSAVWV